MYLNFTAQTKKKCNISIKTPKITTTTTTTASCESICLLLSLPAEGLQAEATSKCPQKPLRLRVHHDARLGFLNVCI